MCVRVWLMQLGKREARLQRAWLLHWTIWPLFLFFLNPSFMDTQRPEDRSQLNDKKNRLLDFFFHEK